MPRVNVKIFKFPGYSATIHQKKEKKDLGSSINLASRLDTAGTLISWFTL